MTQTNDRYPEQDIMFEKIVKIAIVRVRGYDVVGYGIGIKGSKYPGDLREIIPAPHDWNYRDCTDSVVDLIEYSKL